MATNELSLALREEQTSPRLSGRGKAPLIVLLGFIWTVPLLGGAGEKDPETLAVARIESFPGGRVVKNPAGKIFGVVLMERKGRLTDEEFRAIDLEAFKDLDSLVVRSWELTDKSLERIAHMRPLTRLELFHLAVTEEALIKLLKKQGALRSLGLHGLNVTDRVLPEIGKMKRLDTLILYRNPITDKGLKHIAGLDELRFLGLRDTGISDAGLIEVSKMARLFSLDVSGTEVTDGGLLQLAPLKDLRVLHVDNTKVTDKGKRALKQLLPDLAIK